MQPPKLCNFQDASYVLSYSAGNKSWSREPVVIRETGWVVKEEISSDIRPNTNYTIAVIVITNTHNFTSTTTIQYSQRKSHITDSHSIASNTTIGYSQEKLRKL